MLRIIIISSDWGHVLIGIWSWRLDFWFRIGSTWKNQIDWIKREYSLWKWCELDEIIPVWLTKLKCILLGKIFYGIYQPSQSVGICLNICSDSNSKNFGQDFDKCYFCFRLLIEFNGQPNESKRIPINSILSWRNSEFLLIAEFGQWPTSRYKLNFHQMIASYL